MPRSACAGRHRREVLPGPGALFTAVAVVVLVLTATVAGAVVLTGASTPGPGGVDGLGTAPLATRSPSPSPASSPTSGPSPTPAPPPTRTIAPSPTGSDGPRTDPVTALEDLVTALVNDERAAAGCQDLRSDERLRTAARLHSQDMAEHDYFDHTGRDGSTPSDRVQRAGYPGGAGENIAYGYPTPEAVMAGWMGSDGHRANILDCDYVAIGVGLAHNDGGRAYWTQDFGHN